MLRILRSVSAAEGNLGQGDDLIPGSRIHKRQRSSQRTVQWRREAATARIVQSLQGQRDFQQETLRGYAETLQGQRSDCVTQFGVTQSLLEQH